MWKLFSERARRTITVAQEKARGAGDCCVSTEHLLLALVADEDCVAARILVLLGVRLARVRVETTRLMAHGDGDGSQEITLTPRAQRVMHLAREEAQRLGNDYIGTEHLLLGLVHEGDGLAGRVLLGLGVDLERTRQEVMLLQDVNPRDVVAAETREEQRREKGSIWPRFTERARRVILFAEEEAGQFGQRYVSTEHLLLGLVADWDSVAVRILNLLGVGPGRIRSEIERVIARGDGSARAKLQLTPRAKRVIDFAHIEARQLNDPYIGTEHLLLGLLRVDEAFAARALDKLGITLEGVRATLSDLRSGLADDQVLDAAKGEAAAVEVQIGDLGILVSPAAAQARVAFAVDLDALSLLLSVIQSKDTYGYRELEESGTVFHVPIGARVKRLQPPVDVVPPTGTRVLLVRVLDGDFAGRKGWISREEFSWIGPDDSRFPPAE